MKATIMIMIPTTTTRKRTTDNYDEKMKLEKITYMYNKMWNVLKVLVTYQMFYYCSIQNISIVNQ